jgi:NAD(P)-dependent dehydrogenase (short-subunit alcohol dehydrogenase family)
MQWFAGKTAIVTGGAHGIGRATAELLASLGARVVVVDKDERGLEELYSRPPYVPWHGDVASEGAGRLAEGIWRRHGPIDLLVNNVGISTPHRFLDLDEADFDRVFHTNLRGPWFFTKQIARHLVDAGAPGSIVFVSSLHDTFVRAYPHYSASKAAVGMLTRELASELGPHRIRVNSLSPGAIRVEDDAPEPEQDPWAAKAIPLGRKGTPADVARMVAVLLSDEWSGYVTGANVRVDGGLALHSWATPAEPSPAPRRSRLARRVLRSPRG